MDRIYVLPAPYSDETLVAQVLDRTERSIPEEGIYRIEALIRLPDGRVTTARKEASWDACNGSGEFSCWGLRQPDGSFAMEW